MLTGETEESPGWNVGPEFKIIIKVKNIYLM